MGPPGSQSPIVRVTLEVVVVLHCARKLLARLPTPTEPPVRRSTTALGDSYATLLFARPQQLLFLVSEISRLPIVVPANYSEDLSRDQSYGQVQVVNPLV